VKKLYLTEFETETVAAFLHFQRKRVDLAVVEVGLGGRLDATNTLPLPEVTVISSIGRDHERWLGHSLEDILFEKSGILRTGVFHYQSTPKFLERKSRSFFRNRLVPGEMFSSNGADRAGTVNWSRFHQTVDLHVNGTDYGGLRLGLLGRHQSANASLALAACHGLRRKGWRIPRRAILEGLRGVRWPGRFQILGPQITGGPSVILDGAHNPDGMKAFVSTYARSPWGKSKTSLIFGCLKGKDVFGMVRCLKNIVNRVWLVPLATTHDYETTPLLSAWNKYNPARVCRNLREAWQEAKQGLKTPLVVTGSLYLVGDALKLFHLNGTGTTRVKR